VSFLAHAGAVLDAIGLGAAALAILALFLVSFFRGRS